MLSTNHVNLFFSKVFCLTVQRSKYCPINSTLVGQTKANIFIITLEKVMPVFFNRPSVKLLELQNLRQIFLPASYIFGKLDPVLLLLWWKFYYCNGCLGKGHERLEETLGLKWDLSLHELGFLFFFSELGSDSGRPGTKPGGKALFMFVVLLFSSWRLSDCVLLILTVFNLFTSWVISVDHLCWEEHIQRHTEFMI